MLRARKLACDWSTAVEMTGYREDVSTALSFAMWRPGSQAKDSQPGPL